MRVLVLVGLLCLTAAGRPSDAASDQTDLEVSSPSDAAFEAVPGAEILRPGSGEVALIGRITDPRFAIAEMNQAALRAPDGRLFPLAIETESVFREFDRIVSLRFYVMLPESVVAADGRFAVVWGPEVVSPNRTTGPFGLDPALRERYRELRPPSDDTSPGGQGAVASIEVIADSHAEYYFLWYLLPMAVIFVILTLRKWHGRNADT